MRFHVRFDNAVVLRPLLAAILCMAAIAQVSANRAASEEVRALYEAGAWTQAARLAASAQPRSADLELYLGLAQARLSQLDGARKAFLTGHHNYPGDARFAEELAGLAYHEKKNREAKRWLESALNRHPDSAYANDFLGLLFLSDDNLPAALKYWNRIGKPYIHEVHLDPAPELNPLLRERAIAISVGQLLSADRLRMTRSNLARSGILTGNNFALSPQQDQRFDLTIPTAGSLGATGEKLGGWVGTLLPYLRGLPYETLHFDRPNIAHDGIALTSLLRWDSNKRRVAVSLAGPVRLSPKWLYRLGFDARDETWDLTTTYFAQSGGLSGLKLRKIEAGGEFEYALTDRLSWTSGLWLERREFRTQDREKYFTSSWSTQFRNGLRYLLWDWPERRMRAEAAVDLDTGRILTGVPGRETIARGAVSATWLPRAQGDDLAVKLHLGAGRIFGAAPFDDYFMLGMERDNDPDLWLRGHVGTRDGRKGAAPLGTRYTLLQTEIEQTIFRLPLTRVQLAPFLDVGRAADSTGNFGSRGYLVDSGLQAKIKAPGDLTLSLTYGRDLRHGGGVFYTTIERSRHAQ